MPAYFLGAPPLIDVPLPNATEAQSDKQNDDSEAVEPDVRALVGADEYEDADELFPAANSWLNWVCTPQRIVDHRLARHKPLSGTVNYQKTPYNPLGTSESLAQDVTTPKDGWTSTVPDIVQQLSAPSVLLRLTGFGVRIGHRVNAPKLVSYNGKPAYLAREDIRESRLTASGDIIVYRTDWVLDYIVTESSDKIPLVADPVLGVDGGLV